MIRRIGFTRLLAVAFLGLSAIFLVVWLANRIGIGSSYPNGDITLRIWTTEAEDQTALRQVIERYEKRHGNVTVELTVQPSGDYQQALEAAARVGAAPDIFLTSTDRVDRDHTALAIAPRKLLRGDRVRRDFIPAIGEALTDGDTVYGLPLSVDTLALYYRRSIFEGAGVKPPATWNELLGATPKLSQKNGLSVERAAFPIGTPLTDPQASLLQVLMGQNGSSFIRDDKLVFADADQSGYYPGVKALDFFTSFANPQKSSYTWSDSLGSPREAFLNGRSATLIAPWSEGRTFLGSLGNDLGVAPLPAIRSDRPRNIATFSPYVVSASSPNVYAAWDFLRFATTEREIGRYLEKSGRLSPRLDLARSQSRDSRHSAHASQLAVSHTWKLASYPETVRELHVAVVAVLTSKATSSQALSGAQTALSSLLK